MADEQAQSESITVYPTDREIIEAVMVRTGATFSAAIRFIIRDWQALTTVEQVRKEIRSKQKKAA